MEEGCYIEPKKAPWMALADICCAIQVHGMLGQRPLHVVGARVWMQGPFAKRLHQIGSIVIPCGKKCEKENMRYLLNVGDKRLERGADTEILKFVLH
jgi:hypothetical protein